MVLSNKKLKQKLRAELSQSLSASVAKTIVNGDASENRCLKELLGSSTLRPRFSKREKRRKTLSLVYTDEKDGEEKEDESHSVVETQSKKGKRKRDCKKEEEDGISNMVENGEAKQPKKNNKKKKKKKNKKKTKNNEEGNKKDEVTSEEHGDGVSVANNSIESQANGDVAVKVYVGGIPYYSTEDDIRSYFESCGTIAEVDCMIFPETGKFRGIAILTFKTEAAAKRALEMDGSDMCGFFLTLQPYKLTRSDKAPDFSPQIVEGYNRVYLGNLSWDITEDAIRDFFSGCDISSIRFGTDKETKEFKGYAHVDFSNSASLKIALKLDQEIICGRPVKIRCAVPAKGSKINLRPESVPKESTINPRSESVPKESKINLKSEPVPEDSQPEDSQPEVAPTVPIVSGKIRRRTCYECGEKGHLSTDCPNNKQSGDSNPK